MRSLAFNVIFIAGVTSILFNGNALLRYDAYYILSDLLEIPNLGPRGLRYAGYLFQRYRFGVREAEPPESTPGERVWFILYTVASWAYRIFIYVAIVLFIASQFFFIGVLFAIWAAISMMVLPAAKGLKFLSSSPRLSRKRTRSVLVTGLLPKYKVEKAEKKENDEEIIECDDFGDPITGNNPKDNAEKETRGRCHKAPLLAENEKQRRKTEPRENAKIKRWKRKRHQ